MTTRSYDEIARSARIEYENHHATYLARADEIDPKVAKWSDRNKQLEASSVEKLVDEFPENLDEYIAYQTIRNDINDRILPLYQKAIRELSPPILDPTTMAVLERLKIDTSPIDAAYYEIFKVQLNKLNDEKGKFQKLYDRIKPSLEKLRYALEPLAKLRATIYNISVSWTDWASQNTPYVNAAVQARKKELKLIETGPSREQSLVEQKSSS